MAAALAALALTACGRAAPREEPSPARDAPAAAGLFVKAPDQMRVYSQAASSADNDSIRAVMTRLGNAWMKRDAGAVASIYAADVEWTNAFGRVKRDRGELEAFLRNELFAGGTGTPGRSVTARTISFRYVGDDAAVVHTYSENEGQLSPRGTPMGYRRIHNTLVLAKLPEGWRVVQQMIMDQRDTIP
ncbi:MAG: nuclear transport factor 2 family protein [Gemmatimonadaceae bacterium]|nr:nuclear transport factor 2 family protein [Gemmatimonadaceae bacterium]